MKELRPQFIDEIPKIIDEGVLYVSIHFTTAIHLCCCGCGTKVVTPIRPQRWRLTFDGETISLAPSIGNWSFPCRSHYWIERNRVRWAGPMTDAEIAELRAEQRLRRMGATLRRPDTSIAAAPSPRRSLLDRLLRRTKI